MEYNLILLNQINSKFFSKMIKTKGNLKKGTHLKTEPDLPSNAYVGRPNQLQNVNRLA
jgi:hypothetical protein